MSIASLPMYDLPHLRAETDHLWVALRDALRSRGIDAPEKLDRGCETYSVWRDPSLCISQTCGRPYRLGLHETVSLIGAPDYGIGGCPPGYYCSVLVVREDDPRAELTAFRGATCAFNGKDSQSGYANMLSVVGDEDFYTRWQESGSHLQSLAMLARAEADIAAIDAVTWRLAQQVEAHSDGLRVLMRTDPMPGLPFITAGAHDPAPYANAVEDAFATLDPMIRETLGIRGFVRLMSKAYMP